MLEEKAKMLLSFLQDEKYRPMRIKELAVFFGVPKKKRGEFHQVIDDLLKKGYIQIDAHGLVGLPKEMVMQGTFMATSRGFGFVRTEDEDKDDIFIPERYCSNAFHGDIVQVQITKEGNGRRREEGRILKVLERKTTRLVGTFTKNKNVTFVVPDQEKITRDIYIAKGDTLGAVDGHKVVVELKNYGDEDKSPEGIVIQILGHINDPGVDILSIIKGYGLPEEFPEDVMKETAGIPYEVSPKEMAGRVDLRHLDTVTIDGEDAKDLDDAITLQVTEDGLYELGVHIADVSHYVTENSALDKEALNRGTSVYLVDRVIPMIPHKLSNGICSLNAGVDRLALSCLITYDEHGKIKRHRICESVIQVTERMNYSDVRDILVYEKEETCKRYEPLIPMFRNMEKLAAILRKGRKKQGSIDFDFQECKILLDKNGKPTDIVPYDRNVATRMIEEFMLAANKVVAEDYFWMDIPFLYRIHEIPDHEKIDKLQVFLQNFGIYLKSSHDEIHPKEVQKLLTKIEGTPEKPLISRLTLRSMKQAKYSAYSSMHFGLSTRYYCHFTSPIRRYPDLQIHRIIKETLHNKFTTRRFSHYDAILPKVAEQSSKMERRAEEVEREVCKLKKAEYMRRRIGEVHEGIISGVTNWGIYVELPNTIEGMVHVSILPGDYYYYDEKTYSMVGERTGRTFKLGEKAKIRVKDVDMMLKNIDFELVEDDDYEQSEDGWN